MSEIASIAVNTSPVAAPKEPKVVFTDIQRRMARDEKVPIRDLPGITENDERVLSVIGVYTVQELIFCSNKKLFQALGGKGSSGAKRAVRRINGILCAHAFTRRISRRDYLIQVENIQKHMP